MYLYINTFIYKFGVLVVLVALIGSLFTLLVVLVVLVVVVLVVGLLTALRAAPRGAVGQWPPASAARLRRRSARRARRPGGADAEGRAAQGVDPEARLYMGAPI